jgi:hypothetical protein
MRADQSAKSSLSGTTRVGLIIAVAVHVVIIAAILRSQHTTNVTAGDDTIEGSARGATIGGAQVKPIWRTHHLAIVDENGIPLDAARVHELPDDSLKITSRDGVATFNVRAGAMFFVRVTKRGYEPLSTRLPNSAADTIPTAIRLVASRPRTP